MTNFTIRKATLEDLKTVTHLESQCFPPGEAAVEASFHDRLTVYPKGFLVGEINGEIVGHINGGCADSDKLHDEYFESMASHRDDGKHLMVYGLAVLPGHQGNGYAKKLMKAYIDFARGENKEAILLTCKDDLVPFYQRFGYVNEGLSQSSHGGAVWYDMRLNL